jgi:parvulin-like peptidyl-prolyl isomerase
MVKNTARTLLLTLLICGVCAALRAEEIDRIVARIENDVILLSEVRELSHYQKLVNGQSESDAKILDRLIDQWVVRSEAESSRFPQPSDADVQKTVDRLKESFASPAQYEAAKKENGLSDAQMRHMAAAQLYLSNYLDSRFRPSVQIDPKTVEDFYQNAVVPRAKARGQEPPTFAASREYIQKVLVEQGIDQEADRWLKESRGRIHIENLLQAGTK